MNNDEPMLQFFAYEHLKEELKLISQPFGELAESMANLLPRNPERTVMLRKLLEAKDCAVRAKLYKAPSLMLEVAFEGDTRLDSIGRRLRVASEKKMAQLTGQLYDKVVENLSGKILQKRTGALLGSIRQDLDLTGEVMLGAVYPEPADAKAWALEKGGKDYYVITATKAKMLHFYTKDGEEHFAHSVNHPPSKEFAYLRIALEEMRELVPAGFKDYIQGVVDGGDYG